MIERLIRRGGKLYRELQYPDSTLPVVVDEMVEISFGSPSHPAKCPVCYQTCQSYTRDGCGLLFRHARRGYPCRWPAIEATQPRDNDGFVVVPDQFR